MMQSSQVLEELEKNIIGFVNEELKGVYPEMNSLSSGMKDGVRLIYLVGCIYDYFLPLSLYCQTPESDIQMEKNVEFALRLISKEGVNLSGIKANHFIDENREMIVRCLYQLLNSIH